MSCPFGPDSAALLRGYHAICSIAVAPQYTENEPSSFLFNFFKKHLGADTQPTNNPNNLNQAPSSDFALGGLLKNTQASPEPQGPTCFPGSAIVRVAGRGHVLMRDLRIGDFVLSRITSNSVTKKSEITSHHYSQVTAWLHRDANLRWGEGTCVELKSRRNMDRDSLSLLRMSNDHLVFLENGQAIPAGDVVKGNKLMGVFGSAEIVEEPTTDVLVENGVYAPLTLSGTIVVNEILCSCYAPGQDIEFFYKRFLCGLFGGTCHSACDTVIQPMHWMKNTQDGIHPYAWTVMNVVRALIV